MDIDTNLTVDTSIGIRDGCGIEYMTNADGNIEFRFGGVRPLVTLIFDLPALRLFVELAGDALEKVAVSIVRRERYSGEVEGEANAGGHLLPSDAGWAEDNGLIAELTKVNTGITRYVLQHMDADAGRAEPISSGAEYAFGQQLIDVGALVRRKAAVRIAEAEGTRPVVEGEIEQPPMLDPGRGSDMDSSP